MTDIRKMVELHELCDSQRQVARETGSSRNTVKKYIELVKRVREGKGTEILPKNREIHQPPRVVTLEVLAKIHRYLETNQDRPKKQRLTAKRIHELLRKDGIKNQLQQCQAGSSQLEKGTRSSGSVYPPGTKTGRAGRI